MNRRLTLLVTSPALLLGLILMIACAVSLVAIHSVQRRLLHGMSDKVAGLRAAHQMEVAVRQIPFHHLMSLIHPSRVRLQAIAEDQLRFEQARAGAKSVVTAEQRGPLRTIEEHYKAYRKDLNETLEAPEEFSKDAVCRGGSSRSTAGNCPPRIVPRGAPAS